MKGEPFVIARGGKPLVKVVAVDPDIPRRTGFLQGRVDIPHDFDSMFADEIAVLFNGAAGAPRPGQGGGAGNEPEP